MKACNWARRELAIFAGSFFDAVPHRDDDATSQLLVPGFRGDNDPRFLVRNSNVSNPSLEDRPATCRTRLRGTSLHGSQRPARPAGRTLARAGRRRLLAWCLRAERWSFPGQPWKPGARVPDRCGRGTAGGLARGKARLENGAYALAEACLQSGQPGDTAKLASRLAGCSGQVYWITGRYDDYRRLSFAGTPTPSLIPSQSLHVRSGQSITILTPWKA